MTVTVTHTPTGYQTRHTAVAITETADRFEVIEQTRHGFVTLSTSYHKSTHTYTKEA